jgi:hypothetical protein
MSSHQDNFKPIGIIDSFDIASRDAADVYYACCARRTWIIVSHFEPRRYFLIVLDFFFPRPCHRKRDIAGALGDRRRVGCEVEVVAMSVPRARKAHTNARRVAALAFARSMPTACEAK